MTRYGAIDVEIHEQPGREVTNEEEQAGYAEEGTDAESGDDAQGDGFCPRFEEGSAEDHMLADPDPSYASENVVFERHISDSVVGNVGGNIMGETQLVPNRTCDHVVLRHILAKRLETSLGGQIWRVSGVGLEGTIEAVDIGAAVDIGFSDNAGFKGEDVYGDIHLGMGGVEECFFYLCSEGWGADGREWDVVDEGDLPA